MSYYDEIADMLSRSFTVGRHVSREQIMEQLTQRFPTEAVLREYVKLARGVVEGQIATLEARGNHVLGIATLEDGKLVQPSDVPSFKCPTCGRKSYNPTDITEGYCGACHDWTGSRMNES